MDLKDLNFQLSCRTDSGVHAAINALSFQWPGKNQFRSVVVVHWNYFALKNICKNSSRL